MDLELNGRLALVTGGSRGIGFATARLLAAEGANVAIAARDEARLRQAVDALAGSGGGRLIGVQADTGVDASVAAMIEHVTAELGPVDILVNCAATPNTGPPMSEDRLEEEINVKVRGYLRCIRAVAPAMVERRWGRIINLSGLAARRTGTIVASVRNVAITAMTKNLADELGPSGVNVTVVYPYFTRTESTDAMLREAAQRRGLRPEEVEAEIAATMSLGRPATAEEVATVITFLASPRSVALNGDPVVASGGARGPIFY